MALTYRFINAPSASTKKLLTQRMFLGRTAGGEEELKSAGWGAVLLVQGAVPEMYYAVDIGTKTSPVFASEIIGNCPQHIVTMAFIGNVADVTQVLSALKNEGVLL
ncbi:MAG: microcompartment protein [Synergistaceae bacterium]|jgi:hypothetical protein|nr:microcompartment protein [Synergistaceae bacterium]